MLRKLSNNFIKYKDTRNAQIYLCCWVNLALLHPLHSSLNCVLSDSRAKLLIIPFTYFPAISQTACRFTILHLRVLPKNVHFSPDLSGDSLCPCLSHNSRKNCPALARKRSASTTHFSNSFLPMGVFINLSKSGLYQTVKPRTS